MTAPVSVPVSAPVPVATADTSTPRPAPVRRRVWWLAGAGATAAALTYLGTHDPYQSGHYPGCLLLATTGLSCPACGGTRAAYDLLHGDLGSAFARNPLVPPLFLVGVVLVGYHLARQRWTRLPRVRTAPWLPVALALAALAFGVLRNVPGWSWLSPA